MFETKSFETGTSGTGGSCNTGSGYCGTGGWTGPKPGDPSNNSLLTATPAFGGIDVTWTMPTTYPHAIAFTKLYRGIAENFDSALVLSEVGGNFHYDKVAVGTTYYYWIRHVSVNGTELDLIGPASATAKPMIEDILEMLRNQINESDLAIALREKIQSITTLDNSLALEINRRLEANTLLQQLLTNVRGEVDQYKALLLQEVRVREEADMASITAVDAIAVGVNNNAAVISSERQARIDGDAALATQKDILFTKFAENKAAILTEAAARADADSAQVQRYDALLAQTQANAAAIATEQTVRSQADGALAQRVDSVQATSNAAYGEAMAVAAAIQTEQTARIDGDSANALATQQVESRVNASLAQVRTDMGAVVNDMGVAKSFYYVRLNANGLAGGFGIWNNGAQVDAGFDVDRFWVGSGATNKIKPFIVDQDTVYINQAVIKDGTISNAKIADEIRSLDYSSGNTGWRITKSGNAEFNNAVFRGTLAGASGTFSGSLNAATGSFAGALSAASGTFTGDLVGARGTFSGSLTASAINAVNTLNIAGNAVTVVAAGYSPGYSGTAVTVSVSANDLAGGPIPILVMATMTMEFGTVFDIGVNQAWNEAGNLRRETLAAGCWAISLVHTVSSVGSYTFACYNGNASGASSFTANSGLRPSIAVTIAKR